MLCEMMIAILECQIMHCATEQKYRPLHWRNAYQHSDYWFRRSSKNVPAGAALVLRRNDTRHHHTKFTDQVIGVLRAPGKRCASATNKAVTVTVSLRTNSQAVAQAGRGSFPPPPPPRRQRRRHVRACCCDGPAAGSGRGARSRLVFLRS